MLRDKRVLLGVAGGIAAYKAPFIVRELTKAGAEVRVILTRSAAHFVAPLALQVVSGAAVGTDLFDPRYEAEIGHIELARWADVVLVAPATANLVGRLANGLADDLLTTVLLATTAPVVVAPAMNTQMLQHPRVQRNLRVLREELGARLVDPDQGELACKEIGPGRLPDPEILLDALEEALSPKPLAGKRVLVTVGPTREHVDAVRYLTNASSGRMGFAMAAAARHLGASVVAVAGPTEVVGPPLVEVVRVESADEMFERVASEVERGVDIAVFTAAVADVRPASRADLKITKGDLPGALPLLANRDILASVAAREPAPFTVGFAAETHDLEARTLAKAERKGCDLIVGNDVSGGKALGTDDNSVIVADRHRVHARLGPLPKLELARAIWDVVARLYDRPDD